MNGRIGTGAAAILDPTVRLRELVQEVDGGGSEQLLEVARRRTRHVLQSVRSGADPDVSAALSYLAEVTNLLALRPELDDGAIRLLVDEAAKEAGLEPGFVRAEVCSRALRDPSLLARLPRVAIPAQLRVLSALTENADVSLWTQTAEGSVEEVWPSGETADLETRRVRARAAIRGDAAFEAGADFVALRVLRAGRVAAALVVGTPAPGREWALGLLHEATLTLGVLLEREALLHRNEEGERALVQSSERRMVRLGFDLHDGAIQDLAALASDVRLFREQLTPVVSQHEHEGVILGRIDDLLSRLYSLDGDLRRLVRSFETPTTASRPLEDVLRDEVELFRSRADIDVALAVDGDFSDLTASQRIALLRVVQEAMTNAREHSGGGMVEVQVVRRGGYVHAEIRDDGCGFDVERTLTDAARRGRLGLLGMSERVRLLGGMFDIESREGGPTSVLVALPEWRPDRREQAGKKRSTTEARPSA